MASVWRTAPSTQSQPKLSWFLPVMLGYSAHVVADDFFDEAPPGGGAAFLILVASMSGPADMSRLA